MRRRWRERMADVVSTNVDSFRVDDVDATPVVRSDDVRGDPLPVPAANGDAVHLIRGRLVRPRIDADLAEADATVDCLVEEDSVPLEVDDHEILNHDVRGADDLQARAVAGMGSVEDHRVLVGRERPAADGDVGGGDARKGRLRRDQVNVGSECDRARPLTEARIGVAEALAERPGSGVSISRDDELSSERAGANEQEDRGCNDLSHTISSLRYNSGGVLKNS